MNIPKIQNFFDLSKTDYAYIYEDIEYPWEVINKLEDILTEKLTSDIQGSVSSKAYVGKEVFIGSGSRVEPGATIMGPAIIGSGCLIRSGAYIRQNVIVGNNVTIGHSTEIKNSLLHNQAEIPHFSYVGDSVIGWNAHLGAGVKISNLKVTRESIIVHLKDGDIDTGLRKFGCLLGDQSEIGCNSVINPGTLIGKRTLSTANVSLKGYYSPDTFVKLRQDTQETKRFHK